MSIKVRKDRLDWVMVCEEHDEIVWTDSQISAFEAGLGHFMMCHKPFRPMWDLYISDGRHHAEVFVIAKLDTSSEE